MEAGHQAMMRRVKATKSKVKATQRAVCAERSGSAGVSSLDSNSAAFPVSGACSLPASEKRAKKSPAILWAVPEIIREPIWANLPPI